MHPFSTLISQELFVASSGLQFTLEVSGLRPNTLLVVNFDFVEAYNECYEINLSLVSSVNDINIAELLDGVATFKVWQDGMLQREVSGIVAYIEQGETGFRRTFYRLKLVPQLYRLTLRRNSRIFQQKTIEEIIQIILKEHNILFYHIEMLELTKVREYCVQYRETDFEFLQRLCGEEGIMFCFYQTKEGIDSVQFFNSYQILAPSDALSTPYSPSQNRQLSDKTVTVFQFGHQLRPNRVFLKDHTFKNPNWIAEYNQEKSDRFTKDLHLYRHYDAPGRYKDNRGKFYAETRMDTLRRDANIGRAESNDIRLAVGRLFRLSDHKNPLFNSLWQPIKIHHHGEQAQALEEESPAEGTYLNNWVDFIPRRQNYRANFPQKPLVWGTQTARVVGPAGEEIFTDNYGRVKVRFDWEAYDYEDPDGESHSCWIRTTSPWAGQGWGMLALPRVGQEVIVSFNEGDPDQPIIIGRAYNAIQPPPGNLPLSKTQMHIRSKTYKGEGHNSIMFDDATYNELFEMHAEKNMETLVKNDQRNHIKRDRNLTVDRTQTTTIGEGRVETITTGNDMKTLLAGNEMKSVLIGNSIETVGLLKSIQAKDIFSYAHDSIELEVNEQTSITMDKQQILLRFGQSTILMNEEGIWLDAVHIGVNEKNPVHQNADVKPDESELLPDCVAFQQQLKTKGKQ